MRLMTLESHRRFPAAAENSPPRVLAYFVRSLVVASTTSLPLISAVSFTT